MKKKRAIWMDNFVNFIPIKTNLGGIPSHILPFPSQYQALRPPSRPAGLSLRSFKVLLAFYWHLMLLYWRKDVIQLFLPLGTTCSLPYTLLFRNDRIWKCLFPDLLNHANTSLIPLWVLRVFRVLFLYPSICILNLLKFQTRPWMDF